MTEGLMVFTGNANPLLAAAVTKNLNLSLGKATVGRFSDGEVNVEIQDHVRGKDVFILQSTCAPTNDNLMEIMVMADALKRSSAGRVTAASAWGFPHGVSISGNGLGAAARRRDERR